MNTVRRVSQRTNKGTHIKFAKRAEHVRRSTSLTPEVVLPVEIDLPVPCASTHMISPTVNLWVVIAPAIFVNLPVTVSPTSPIAEEQEQFVASKMIELMEDIAKVDDDIVDFDIVDEEQDEQAIMWTGEPNKYTEPLFVIEDVA